MEFMKRHKMLSKDQIKTRIKELKVLDISFTVDEGDLGIEGPEDVFTKEILDFIGEYEEEITEIVQEEDLFKGN